MSGYETWFKSSVEPTVSILSTWEPWSWGVNKRAENWPCKEKMVVCLLLTLQFQSLRWSQAGCNDGSHAKITRCEPRSCWSL